MYRELVVTFFICQETRYPKCHRSFFNIFLFFFTSCSLFAVAMAVNNEAVVLYTPPLWPKMGHKDHAGPMHTLLAPSWLGLVIQGDLQPCPSATVSYWLPCCLHCLTAPTFISPSGSLSFDWLVSCLFFRSPSPLAPTHQPSCRYIRYFSPHHLPVILLRHFTGLGLPNPDSALTRQPHLMSTN